MVEATGDLLILRPTDSQLANGVALVDVANRGRLVYALSGSTAVAPGRMAMAS